MKIKLLYILILLFVFTYGVIVGKYQFFPYDILKFNYSIISNSKKKILGFINFSKNKKCVQEINKEIKLTKNPDYSFFIAGHTYGSPRGKNLGIYPKFYNELLNNKNIFDFGILAGDVVRHGDEISWEVFDNQIKKFDFRIYIAPGNHEVANEVWKINFNKRYVNLYQSFKFGNDLFVILNPYENKWSIKNEQLDFLKNELQNNYQFVDNIFIITHPVIFINKKFKVKNNNFIEAGKNINFWNEIYPLFKKYNNNYYIVAGDVGIHNGFELFCNKFEKNIFLASGMGGEMNDNYLIFKKIKKKIKIEVKRF